MLKTIAVVFFVRGLGSISAFILTIVIARQLPTVEAGYFFLAFATISILFPISLFGTQTASLRFIGADFSDKNWANIHGVSIAMILIALVSGVFFSCVFWLLSPYITNNIWHKPNMQPITINIALTSFFMTISTLIANQLQAIRKAISSVIVLSIVIPLCSSIIVVVIGINSALDATKWLLLVSIVNLLISFAFWLRYSQREKPSFPNIVFLIKTCLPLWVITLMSALAQWGGQFISGAWVEPEDLAYLAAAQRTAMLVSFILISVNFVVAPRFASLYKQGKLDEFRLLAVNSVRIMMLVAIPIILVMILFSKQIMLMFGGGFSSASHLLIILAVGQLINAVTGSVGFILTMSGHEIDLRNIIFVSSILTISLALVLCYYYGVTGAAIATAIGVSIQNLAAAWMVKKRFGFNMLAVWSGK